MQTTPRIALLDLAESAENMIDAAVAVTTGRLHLASPVDVRHRLVRGDATTVAYFRYELSRQVAAALLWMDEHVRAVYEEQDVPPGEELAAEEPSLDQPLRLFVEVDAQTSALHIAVGALSEALGRAMDGLTSRPPCRFIEAIVVDEGNRRLLRPSAGGYRPAPALLAARPHDDDAREREALERLLTR